MKSMTEAKLLSNLGSLPRLIQRQRQQLEKTSQAASRSVERALPLFAGAAAPDDYKRLLAATLRSAGLRVDRLTIELKARLGGECTGACIPTPSADSHSFHEHVRVAERKGRGWTGRSFYLDVTGEDPECLLVTHLFDPLFAEGFEQAATNWFLKYR